MDGWYVGVNGQQRGPLSLDEAIAAARAAGPEQTYVWREGFSEWKIAADVPEFAEQFRTATSPGRPMPPMPTSQARGAARATVSHPAEVFATGRGRGLSLSEAVRSCFGKYATFQGRAPRSEYWFWTLFVGLSGFVLVVIDTALAIAMNGMWPFVLTILFSLAVIIPGISVTVRRLHDIDFTGWWFWIWIIPFGTLVLLVFHLMRGTTGPNNYGEDPLGG